MTSRAREAALRALMEVTERGRQAEEVLDRYLEASSLEGRDRALFTELLYGTVRRLNTLDWMLNHFASRPIDEVPPPIRAILRTAAYQVMYLERVPPRAAVHEAVNLAKRYGHRGTAGFVNGVLRALVRGHDRVTWPADPVARLALEGSHPEWMVDRWLERFGEDATRQLLRWNNRRPPLTVRPNPLRATARELVEDLAQRGFKVRTHQLFTDLVVLEGPGRLREVPGFREGLFTVQSAASYLVGRVVAPKAGEAVLDLCAAPGTKTTQLAEMMENRGRVLAVDVNPERLKLVGDAAERLGLTIVETAALDARRLGDAVSDRFARVLVDAPCSGLGVLARNPDARWRKQPGDIRKLAELQSEILKEACRMVAPGGVLVYSTCTTEPEENQCQIEQLLAERDDFEAEDIRPYLPEVLRGAASSTGVQLYPHLHQLDGFFIARLRRKA